MYKRSQVSNEFMVLICMSFLLFIMFIAAVTDDFADLRYHKEQNSIRDLGFLIQHEIMIASDVADGYERVFNIPDRTNSYDFTVSNTANEVVLESESGFEQVFNIPTVDGNLVKGDNTIRKSGGAIYLN